MPQAFLALGAFILALAIAAGAFGAHALKGSLEPRALEIFELAVRYQIYHGLGLMIVAIASHVFTNINLRLIGGLMAAGTFTFSGTLYVIALTDIKWIGAITPIGGLSLIIAWLSLAWRAFKACQK